MYRYQQLVYNHNVYIWNSAYIISVAPNKKFWFEQCQDLKYSIFQRWAVQNIYNILPSKFTKLYKIIEQIYVFNVLYYQSRW